MIKKILSHFLEITNKIIVQTVVVIVLSVAFFLSFSSEVKAQTYTSNIWQYTSPQNITGADDLKQKLEAEVQKVISSGHLAPFRALYGEYAISYYWYHSYDSVYTLSLAYPYVNSSLQSSIKTYLQSEMSTYPLWSSTLFSTNTGTKRQTDELTQSEFGDIPSLYGNRPQLFSLYALWLYAKNTNNWSYIESNWSSITSFYNANRSEVTQSYSSIAGAIGYARMAEQKPTKDTSARTMAVNDITNGLTSGRNFTQFGLNATNSFNFDSWVFSNGNIDSIYQGFQFLDITPEIGRYMVEDSTLKSAVLGNTENDIYSLKKAEYFFPLWYMGQGPFWTSYYGEGSGIPVDAKAMVFPLKAWVQKQPASQLRKYLDVPDALLGDFFYMQNIARTIEASGIECWEDILTTSAECIGSPISTPTPTPIATSTPKPSASPTPTPSGNPTPTPLPTSTPNPTPSPTPCSITSVSWGSTTAVENANVGITIQASGSCSGKQVNLITRQAKTGLPDVNAINQPLPNPITLTQVGSIFTASSIWKADTWVNACIIGTCDPVYFTKGNIVGTTTEVTTDRTRDLIVTKLKLGNGDANGDGKVDIADVKLVLQNWGNSLTTAVDQYSDGFINLMDFSQTISMIPTATPTSTPTPTPAATGTPLPTSTPGPITSEWTQFGHDAQRTSYTPQTVATPWKYLWQWNGANANGQPQTNHLRAPDYAQPITGGGRIYMVTTGGVYALNPTTGSVLWSNTSLGTLTASPAYDSSGYIYVGSSNKNLYKLNASTGAVVGSYTASSALNLSVTLFGSIISTVADDGTLIAINTSTMTRLWSYVGGSPGVTPATYSSSYNLLVYITQDLYVHAVNVADGTRKWRVKPTVRNYECVDDGNIYTSCNVVSSSGAQAVQGWPVIAEQHGIVFVRYWIDQNTLWTWSPFPTTNSAIRSNLISQPNQQPLFALKLDTGASAFIPAVGNGSAGDGGYGPTGPMPIVTTVSGKELVYIQWRNGNCDPYTQGCDGRGDSHLGEMVLDDTTLSGYQAGDLRFINYQFFPTDETMQVTMAGNTLFTNHWLVVAAQTITNRSASVGDSPTNGIQTSVDPFLLWRATSAPYGPGCSFDAIHRYCTNLYTYADTRMFPAGFYEYWNASGDNWGNAYTIVGNNLVLVKTTDSALIALQNGNPLAGKPSQSTLAQTQGQTSVLGATTQVPVIPYTRAPKYLDQTVTATGTINAAVNHRPKAIYLGFTNPHDGALLVRIFEKDLNKFSYDPMTLKGKRIKVTGKVTLYWPENIDPEIIVTDPSQIQIQ